MKEKFSSIVGWLSDPEPIRPSNAGPTVEDGMNYLDDVKKEAREERRKDAQTRLDRLCVIAAGVLGSVPHSASSSDEHYVNRIAVVSRAILAKLEEE